MMLHNDVEHLLMMRHMLMMRTHCLALERTCCKTFEAEEGLDTPFAICKLLQTTTYDFRISSLSLSWLVGYEYQNFVLSTLSYSLCGNIIFMLESSL